MALEFAGVKKNGLIGLGIDHTLRTSEEDIANAPKTENVKSDLIPLYDRIVVRRKVADVMSGVLYIPEDSREKPQEGEVLSVGQGRVNDSGQVFPLNVKAKDRVLFGKYAGTEITLDGEQVLIMREEEVLGILKGKVD